MGKDSAIEWTHHTFNPWWGCTKVSPGCANCYAESFDKRLGGKHWGPGSERKMFGDKHWDAPLKWNADAAKRGVRERVFCASMADVFEDREDLLEPRARLWTLVAKTPHLDWLLLTKRPEKAEALWLGAHIDAFDGAESLGLTWRPNVWVGATMENQEQADIRAPLLSMVPARIVFVSMEPLLGPIEINPRHRLDWVIVGGESGAGARRMNPEWARSVRDQCKELGIPFHFKQWGQHDELGVRVGKTAAGRVLDGRTWDEFPRPVVAV